MNYLSNASIYLIETLLGFLLYIVLLRFWMQWVKANFKNPIGQFIISVTNPLVIPLRKILPSVGAVDSATVLLAYVIALIKTSIVLKLLGYSPAWLGLLMFSLGEVIEASIYLFIVAIFIQIVVSWINPHSYHPIIETARSISEPLMAPARKLIPSIGGLDFSPIAVLIFLNLSLQLIVAPLQHI